MSLTVAIIFSIAGLGLLALGGEVLVRGAIAVSRLLRISLAVVGLTVVAAATSLPELAVSVTAVLKGNPDVAVGNAVGSNIFNLAAILGISALIFPPLRFRASLIRFDVAVMVLAAGLALLFARDTELTFGEGLTFVVLLAAFLFYRARSAGNEEVPAGEATAQEIETEVGRHRVPWVGTAAAVTMVLIGSGLLTAGADLLVRGAETIARMAGVSQRVIAITLVSAGTGLPELATSITAGLRKGSAASIAVGNIIGSNIFNIFGILGISSLIRTVAVAPKIAGQDMWWMIGFSLLALIPVFHSTRGMWRFEGLIALALYVLYLANLV